MLPTPDFAARQHSYTRIQTAPKTHPQGVRQLYGRHLFPYLPDASWMQQAGYKEKLVGDYYHQQEGQSTYRVVVLSQSSLVFFYRDGTLLKAEAVASDEELLRLLALVYFPLPA